MYIEFKGLLPKNQKTQGTFVFTRILTPKSRLIFFFFGSDKATAD